MQRKIIVITKASTCIQACLYYLFLSTIHNHFFVGVFVRIKRRGVACGLSLSKNRVALLQLL